MDDDKKQNNDEPTNYEILEAINSYATGTDRRLEKIEGRLDGIDGRLDGIDGRIQKIEGRLDGIEPTLAYVKSQMVTKEYLDDKLADLRGDIIVMLRKEDNRLTSLVGILHGKKVISDDDVQSLTKLQPLLQIP